MSDTHTNKVINAATVQERTAQTQAEALRVALLAARPECLPLQVPFVESLALPSQFSLVDVIDMSPFRAYGRQLAAHPSDALECSTVSPRAAPPATSDPEAEPTLRKAENTVFSQSSFLDRGKARHQLLLCLVGAPQIPVAANQWHAAEPIVDAFLAGVGADIEHLAGCLDKVARGLVARVARGTPGTSGHSQMSETVSLRPLPHLRTGRARTSTDFRGRFTPQLGYVGFAKSMYLEDWFDSQPERDLAHLVDEAVDIQFWLRLQPGDVTLWREQDSWYNPDFLIVEKDATSWVIEVKSDREFDSDDAQARKAAAEVWARHVNASGVAGTWRYLLLSDSQLDAATGDWRRLKAQYVVGSRR